ncbi:MAG: PepSY domain-containing protein [Mycobacterium sp.]|nr:PepSY domain-containing protein [Mycobacterium sp.]
MRLHFYAGIFVGPFVLTAAVTGLLCALTAQTDNVVNRHELTVVQVGEHRLSLADQIAVVRSAYPGATVHRIRPPTAPNTTTRVTLHLQEDLSDHARTVFVDPYSGEIRGTLTTNGEWMPLRVWFTEFHRSLHLGAVGRNYSELAASWLWVIAGAGLLLWIGRHSRAGRLKRLFVPDSRVRGRRRLSSWHGCLGVWIIAALLLLSVSGMTWSRYAGAHVTEIRSHLAWSKPLVDTTLPGVTPETGAGGTGRGSGRLHHGGGADASFDEAQALRGADNALRAAHNAHLSNQLLMYPPSGPGRGWQVAENKRDWPTRYDAISVDPDSGAVTARVNFADWPVMAKLTDWVIRAHMGVLFGIVNQILLAAVALALIAVILLGYRMWWHRRPTRSAGFELPKGPRRGTMSALRRYERALVIIALAVFGYFAPLFGLSLMVFIAVDVVFGWWKTRFAVSRRCAL